MNNLNNLKEQYKRLGEEIERLENDKGVWTPQKHDVFFLINSMSEVIESTWLGSKTGYYRLYNSNVFKTEDEAQRYADIDFKYKKLVFELNQESPVDWKDSTQRKYNLYYNHGNNKLETGIAQRHQFKGIYCTDEDILQKAIDLIGEYDLIWYIKRG